MDDDYAPRTQGYDPEQDPHWESQHAFLEVENETYRIMHDKRMAAAQEESELVVRRTPQLRISRLQLAFITVLFGFYL